MVKCKAQDATKLHMGRNAGITGKWMSPLAVSSPLRSLFTVYTANQLSGLQHSCSLQRISTSQISIHTGMVTGMNY